MHHNVEPCGAEQQSSECRLSKAASEQYSAVQQLYGVEQQSSGCSGGGQEKETGTGRSTPTSAQVEVNFNSAQSNPKLTFD